MTAIELRTMLVTMLTRTVGGPQRRWRLAIGEVAVYPLATHPHCNWAINPSGTIAENAAIERALDSVRLDHPYVS